MPRRNRYDHELPLFDAQLPRIERKSLRELLAQPRLSEVMKAAREAERGEGRRGEQTQVSCEEQR